jgi:GxxExxY protein
MRRRKGKPQRHFTAKKREEREEPCCRLAKGEGPGMEPTRDQIEAVATAVVDASIRVHRQLGPGLLESTYQACLAHKLRGRGLKVECEVPLPIQYRGAIVDAGYRLDMLVADEVIVENKSIQALLAIHEAQLLTYLKLSKRKVGFLVNWNVPLIKDGIKRLVNGL